MENDPFLVVKQQVQEQLENASTLFDSWKRIQQTVSSPSNQELVWTADELHSSLEAIEQDLDDLDEAFSVSQSNPEKFNLTTSELNSRRSFLAQSRNSIQKMRNTMANPPKRRNEPGFGEGSSQQHNDRLIENEQQQQMIMMQEQDTHLDSMSGTLGNLKDIAGTMNREIDDHVIILDELGDHVDRSQGRLKRAMGKVTHILKKEEESKSGYCICCLIVVLIVLLVLIIVI